MMTWSKKNLQRDNISILQHTLHGNHSSCFHKLVSWY